jgi:hypothetical protein
VARSGALSLSLARCITAARCGAPGRFSIWWEGAAGQHRDEIFLIPVVIRGGLITGHPLCPQPNTGSLRVTKELLMVGRPFPGGPTSALQLLAAGLHCTACLLMLNAYQTWQGYDSMLCHAQGAKQDAQLRRLERAFAMDHVDVFHVSLVRIFPPLVLRVPRQQQSSLAHLILKAIGLGQIIYQHLFLLERTLVYPIISRKLTIISRSPGSHTRTRSQRYSAVRARVIPSFTTSLEH